jgi:hypothetical protein
VIRSQALFKRARPAKPPKPWRDLEVIQVGTIAAAGADELIHVVVAALDTVGRDAGRLVPQDRRGAVAGLTSEKDRVGDVGPGTPRVTAILGHGAETATGREAGPVPVTMSGAPGLLTQLTASVVSCATGVWSSDLALFTRR